MNCISEKQAFEFVQGFVSNEESEQIERHFDQCAMCLAMASEFARSTTLRSGKTIGDASRQGLEIARGTRLGRYVVERMLGAGAMGLVYEARDEQLQRRVAIKVLRADLAKVPANRQRMLREARAIARVSHPHVVAVYDVGVVGNGIFLAMELVEGPSLRQWLHLNKPGWRQVIRVLVQAGRGLVAAHQAGLVHRDFKPENVLLKSDERALVADFGLARLLESSASVTPSAPLIHSESWQADSTDTTGSSGMLLGTPAYMAPEQEEGSIPDELSDQYSFSVVLYEALYGLRPSANALPNRSLRSSVPSRIVKIVERGLSKERSKRFSSMQSLIEALESAAQPARWPALLAAALVAVAVLIPVVEARWRAWVQERECNGAAQAARALWSETQVSQARRAFDKTLLPFVESTFKTVDETLQRFIESWAESRKEACLFRTRGASSAVFEPQEACLNERISDLSAMVQLLTQADALMVQTAIKAVKGLTPPAACVQESLLQTQAAPSFSSRVSELNATLARVVVLAHAGQHQKARGLAKSAVVAADALAIASLSARARYTLGYVLTESREASSALEALDAADDRADVTTEERLGNWKPVASPTIGRASHVAIRLRSGQVLLIGGIRITDSSQTLPPPNEIVRLSELYDPVSKTWSKNGRMIAARADSHRAVLLNNDEVLVVGGSNHSHGAETDETSPTAEVFSPRSQTWQMTQPMNEPRLNASVALLNSGQVLIAGGYFRKGKEHRHLKSVELYDPVSRTFSRTSDMNFARGEASATPLPDGRVLVVGGTGAENPGNSSAEIFDPSSEQWYLTGSLHNGRDSHQAIALQSGKVLVVGGFRGESQEITTELFDPATGTWSLQGSLSRPRNGFGVSRLKTGAVIIAGSSWEPEGVGVEIYNPSTGTWSLAASLSVPRAEPTLTLLKNGEVLAVGGARYFETADGGMRAETNATSELFTLGQVQ